MPTSSNCVACRSLGIRGDQLCSVHREAPELERFVRDYVELGTVADIPLIAEEYVRRGKALLDLIDAVEE